MKWKGTYGSRRWKPSQGKSELAVKDRVHGARETTEGVVSRIEMWEEVSRMGGGASGVGNTISNVGRCKVGNGRRGDFSGRVERIQAPQG